MTPSASSEQLFQTMLAALQTRSAFPFAYPVEEAEPVVVQTHASAVILTPEVVYKLKKPRDFGFFDYSTATLRRHFCQQEVILNAPLAPDTYLGIALVLQSLTGEFRFSDTYAPEDVPLAGTELAEGVVIDYAVVMRRLPEERTLALLLQSGPDVADDIQDIAKIVAHFHKTTPTNEHIAAFGQVSMIQTNWDENFAQMAPYIGRTLERETYDGIKEYVERFIEQRQGLFERRIEQQYVRDCHGDLRLQHIYVMPGLSEEQPHILLLDRIEFNERFRYGDTASEVAFLMMELELAGHYDLAQEFLQYYKEQTGDTKIEELLSFYICYRACVRGKVTSFLLDDAHISVEQHQRAQQEARQLFQLAYQYAKPAVSPVLVMVGGVMGTGKSTVARLLRERYQWPLFASDVVRKQLAHVALHEHEAASFETGIYTPEWTQKTYEVLREKGMLCLQHGKAVILDATFARREERQKVAGEARRYGAKVLFIECVSPREITMERLKQRWQEQGAVTVSDGRPELYDQQVAHWEAFNVEQEPDVKYVQVETSGSMQEVMRAVCAII